MILIKIALVWTVFAALFGFGWNLLWGLNSKVPSPTK